ncbi:MAG: DUF1565 domain-containing protein, partial [Candidatus Coatesbacteria bacterium]|nr:DUF1565 domain-containing protein [Candidatus Coatesbacteria bacterium]
QDDNGAWSEPDTESLVVSSGDGRIFFVDAEQGNDSNDGTEGAPWKTITHALALASATPATINVLAGTYSASTNGESFPLNMKSWISLAGEDAETTVLDGERNTYQVIYCDGIVDLIIADLTIMGGNADGDSWATICGGGIYCSNASLIIQNNIIVANSARESGGGIYCPSGTLTVLANEISGNSAGSGGGIHCRGEAVLNISDNRISDNSAGAGGAIYCWACSPVISANTISGNIGGYGGAIYCRGGSSVVLENEISANISHREGGAIACQGGSLLLSDNTISGNYALESGGGVFSRECTLTALNNNVSGNLAETGGGFWLLDGQAWLFNNMLSENLSLEYAGAVFAWSSQLLLENCTIAFNESFTGFGGVLSAGGDVEISDCIIWGNGDDLWGCSANYCCIEDDDEGEGNIHCNPMFVPGPLGDWYLNMESPCVDAGSMSAEEAGLSDRTTQADGFLDAGILDMGYHYPVVRLSLKTSLNQENSAVGDLVIGTVECSNAGPALTADAYIGLIYPDGQIETLCQYGYYVSGLHPVVLDLFLENGYQFGPEEMLIAVVPSDVMAGDYVFFSALIDREMGYEAPLALSMSEFEIDRVTGE